MAKRSDRKEVEMKLQLPVRFTEEELQAVGLQLAATYQEIGALTLEAKMSADKFKERIKAATMEAARLAANRISGQELRYVDCTTSYDFENGTKRVVRIDTGEIVSEGPMTSEEQQLAQMSFESATKKRDDGQA